jgi:hypothetical protein
MSTLKILAAAAVTAASISLAFAQGTPPKPGVTDPAVGAGQRSTQNTPMGTTGTPGGTGAAAQGSTAGSAAATTAGSAGASGSMNSGSTASAGTSGGGSMASGSGSGTQKKAKKTRKVAKADRN